MKISTIYDNDIEKYEDITKIISEKLMQYYNIGLGASYIADILSFLKITIRTYLKNTYNKNYKVLIVFSDNNGRIVSIHNRNAIDIVKIRLSYSMLDDLLNGVENNSELLSKDIIEQLDTEISSSNGFKFNEYLDTQTEALAKVALIELREKFDIDFIRVALVDKTAWLKLATSSSVFGDYYKEYNHNNRKLFFKFLRFVISSLS